MAWLDTIREKAANLLLGSRQFQFTAANQAQVFFPHWPDERCPVPLQERGDLVSSSLIMTPINWLGTVLSEPPPLVEEEKPDGTYEPVQDSPMLDLLATPNPYHTGELLLKAFAYSWIVYGNVYWYKARDSKGVVRELWPLDSAAIAPYTDESSTDFITYYLYTTVRGERQQIEPSELLHFRCGLDPRDPRIGLAPIEALWLEIAADQALTRYTQAMTMNFGVPPYCVSPEPDATGTYQLSAALLKKEITEGTSGINTGKVLTFERPVKITMMGMSPDQLSVDKSRRLPEERVASVLNIPGVVLGYGSHLDRATYSNIQTARRLAWEQCVLPTLNSIAAVLREQLLPDFIPAETVDNYWVRFDTSDVAALKEDTNDLYKREVEAFRFGMIKRSEARGEIGLQSDPEDEIYSPQAQGGGGQGALQFNEAESGEEKQLGGFSSPRNLEEISAWWDETAPPEAKGLLEAEQVA